MPNYKEGAIQHERSNLAHCIVTEDGQQHRYAINAKFLKKALHGDHVLVKVADNNTHAFVQKIIKRSSATITGKLTLHESGLYGFVKPWSIYYYKDFYVTTDGESLMDNDVVEIEVVGWQNSQPNPHAKFIRKIYTVNPEQESIYSLDLPLKFDKSIMDEINNRPLVSVAVDQSRINLLSLPTFSLEDTKAIESVFSLEHTGNGFRIGIHTIDVAHYVKPGSQIDREAFTRGRAYRLGTTTVPMLPESLCYDALSFLPHQPRYAISLVINVDQQANIRDYYFFKSVVSNKNNLSTTDTSTILKDSSSTYHTQLTIFKTIVHKLTKHTTHCDLPVEPQWLRINHIIQHAPQTDFEVKKLIHSLNALVNTFASHQLFTVTDELIYKSPKHISMDRLHKVKEKIRKAGFDWKDEFTTAANMENISRSTNDLAREILWHSLAPDAYVTNRYPSNGTQPTVPFHAPLTQYADIITQRLVLATLESKPLYVGDLERVVEHLQTCENKARSASRYLQMRYMVEYSKSTVHPMQATVLATNQRGAFVRTISAITGWLRQDYESKSIGDEITVVISKRMSDGIEFKIC